MEKGTTPLVVKLAKRCKKKKKKRNVGVSFLWSVVPLCTGGGRKGDLGREGIDVKNKGRGNLRRQPVELKFVGTSQAAAKKNSGMPGWLWIWGVQSGKNKNLLVDRPNSGAR